MKPKRLRRVTLGTILRGFGIILVLVLILLYVQFQSKNFILGPTISLEGSYEVVQKSRELILNGSTENIVKLTLNGREINTNEFGEFTQVVFLEKGYSVITLYAEDRFGRSTHIERIYVYNNDE